MINKILVAIDFSDCSINALEHALTIANKAKADIKNGMGEQARKCEKKSMKETPTTFYTK